MASKVKGKKFQVVREFTATWICVACAKKYGKPRGIIGTGKSVCDVCDTLSEGYTPENCQLTGPLMEVEQVKS
jgi:hypothetical protein